MARTGSGAFHQGLTPDSIVDAAVKLTRASNLYGWSLRDLARELGVTASVIYHHIGGKDLLAKRVAERVIDKVNMPPDDLDWQAWFRALLLDGVHEPVRTHPGVAKWLLMHGVPFESAIPIFTLGITKLQQAGFGAGAPAVYSTIMNSAMLTVSMTDERLLHEDDGPRDHIAMMQEFHESSAAHPLLAEFSQSMMAPLAEGGAEARRIHDQYYRYVVEITLAGVSAVGPPAQ